MSDTESKPAQVPVQAAAPVPVVPESVSDEKKPEIAQIPVEDSPLDDEPIDLPERTIPIKNAAGFK